MISALSYGMSGITSSAYYYFGSDGSFKKFTGATSEAGWLCGFTATPTGSNLGPRAVNLYNQVGVARFSFLAGGLVQITARVIPQFVGNADASPATSTWKYAA